LYCNGQRDRSTTKSYLGIQMEYDKLIVSLRTAYSIELNIDKERTSYSDSLDALRLACKMYKMNRNELLLLMMSLNKYQG